MSRKFLFCNTFNPRGYIVDSIGAGNSKHQVATIKKDDIKLYVGLINYSSKEVYLENCCVYQLYFDTKQFRKSEADLLKLPAGITGKSTVEEVRASGAPFAEAEAGAGENSYVTFSYSDTYNNKNISLSIYKEQSEGYYGIKNIKWDY